jgi:predicted transcriptional regulator
LQKENAKKKVATFQYTECILYLRLQEEAGSQRADSEDEGWNWGIKLSDN